MERREAVGWGLAVAGLGHLYYTPVIFTFSALEAFLTAVVAVGLLQAGAAVHAGDPWGAGVGAVTAAVAALWDLRDLLMGIVTAWSVAGFVGAVGLLLLAAALVGWYRAGPGAGRGAEADGGSLDEGRAVRGFRGACAVSALGGLVYGVANVVGGNPAFLPGNVLVVVGFGLPAAVARPGLFAGSREEAPEAGETGRPS